MADILNSTFSVKTENHEFVFRVPRPIDKARQGTRETAIRRMLDPMSAGWADGLDEHTFFLIRGMAVLELFLEKTDAKWVYTETKAEKGGTAVIRVDILEFPAGTEDVIMEVGRGFQAGLDTFHGRGPAARQPVVSEIVESGVDSGAL